MNGLTKAGIEMCDRESLRTWERSSLAVPTEIIVNGRRIEAFPGETVHAALLAAGISVSGAFGVFCGMGVCYECLVTIDGEPDRRSCMTLVREAMEITTHER